MDYSERVPDCRIIRYDRISGNSWTISGGKRTTCRDRPCSRRKESSIPDTLPRTVRNGSCPGGEIVHASRSRGKAAFDAWDDRGSQVGLVIHEYTIYRGGVGEQIQDLGHRLPYLDPSRQPC